MKIKSINVVNYRQYQNLDLDLSSNSDFVVIVGTNGFGKSNLLSAISWCLYGQESKAGKNLHYENSIVNFQVAQQLRPGESCEVSVELDISLSDGQIATIRRSQVFVKGELGGIGKGTDQSFRVLHQARADKGFEDVGDPEFWRDRRFPARLQPYFLFDGERLDSFLREDRAASVESAIMEIAQVDKLEQIKDRIDIVSSEISRDAARISKNSKLTELQERFEIADEKFQLCVESFERQKKTTDEISKKYLEAESRILQMASENEESQRNADRVSEYKTLVAEDDAAWEQFGNWSVSALARILSFPAIDYSGRLISERKENGTLPPRFTSEALVELLDAGRCICGRHLGEEDGSQAQVKGLAEEFALLSGSGLHLHEMRPYVEKLQNSFPTDHQELQRFSRGFRDRRARIDDLTAKLPKSRPPENEAALDPIWSYTELQAMHPDAKVKLGLAEANKERAEVEKNKIKSDLEKAMRLDAKLQKDADVLAFADLALNETRKILEDWKGDVREQVSSALSKEFAPMLPKDKFIEKVWIDDKFVVHVTNTTGNEIVEELSSGERQSLAFAFSFGLNSVSGYSLPMVIDTPFGRMGDEMKEQVASALATNTIEQPDKDSQQVIILMTDSEYSSEVAAKFQRRDPALLRIRNEEGTISTIEAFN